MMALMVQLVKLQKNLKSGYKVFMMKAAKALKLLRDLQWNYACLNLKHIE